MVASDVLLKTHSMSMKLAVVKSPASPWISSDSHKNFVLKLGLLFLLLVDPLLSFKEVVIVLNVVGTQISLGLQEGGFSFGRLD